MYPDKTYSSPSGFFLLELHGTKESVSAVFLRL